MALWRLFVGGIVSPMYGAPKIATRCIDDVLLDLYGQQVTELPPPAEAFQSNAAFTQTLDVLRRCAVNTNLEVKRFNSSDEHDLMDTILVANSRGPIVLDCREALPERPPPPADTEKAGMLQDMKTTATVLNACKHFMQRRFQIDEADWCNFVAAYHDTYGMVTTAPLTQVESSTALLPVSQIQAKLSEVHIVTSFMGHCSEWHPTPAGLGLLHYNIQGAAQGFSYFTDAQLFVEACGGVDLQPGNSASYGTHMMHSTGMKRVVLPPGYAIAFPPGCFIMTSSSWGFTRSLRVFTKTRHSKPFAMCQQYVACRSYHPPPVVHDQAWVMLTGYLKDDDITVEQYTELAAQFHTLGNRPIGLQQAHGQETPQEEGTERKIKRIKVKTPRASADLQSISALDCCPAALESDCCTMDDMKPESQLQTDFQDWEKILPGVTDVKAGQANYNPQLVDE